MDIKDSQTPVSNLNGLSSWEMYTYRNLVETTFLVRSLKSYILAGVRDTGSNLKSDLGNVHKQESCTDNFCSEFFD